MKLKFTGRIWICLILVCLITSGCSPKTAAPELSILEWAGYDNPEYWKAFADQNPAVKVNFTLIEDDPDSLNKMLAQPKTDLAHPCANYWGLYVEQGLVQPIKTSRLEHLDQLYPELLQIGQFEGQQYFIPWDWGYEGIAYRPDKVQTPPTKWSDLWNPEYQGHLAIEDAGENAFMMAALSIGADPYFPSPAQKLQIKSQLKDLKPNISSFWDDDAILNEQMAQGEIWVAGNAWNNTFTTLKARGIPVEYSLPAEGAIGWVCGFGISSQTENLDLAYDYLNAILAPGANARMANEYAYGPANRESIALMDPETVKLLGLKNPNILNLMYMMRPLTREQQEEYVQMWEEIRSAP